MIFYYEKTNYIFDQFNAIIDKLESHKKTQSKRQEILLECLNNINSIIQQNDITYSNNVVIKLLEDVNYLANLIKNNILTNELLRNELQTFESENIENIIEPSDSLKEKIDNFNKLAIDYTKHYDELTLKYETFIESYVKDYLSIDSHVFVATETPATPNSNIPQDSNTTIVTESSDNDNTDVVKDNRVLVISETQNKVFLPYYVEDLEKKLKNSKYQNLQQVIDSEYIVPLSKYKNAIISRFKEAFNLMRTKEHASISDSLSLALELTFNSLLNPAIISACRTLDELDIYLDCLNTGELDKFNIFEIKYEVLPTKVTKNQKPF